MKHKVAELEGALLDAAVALAEGWRKGAHTLHGFDPNGGGWVYPVTFAVPQGMPGEVWTSEPQPWSREWGYGGPIIERERICVSCFGSDWQAIKYSDADWVKLVNQYPAEYGPTPLIAAMRAYVASRFGEEVELP